MYLPSCYVFARWACVSLHVSEGFLSLASGQSGFPALWRQEQSETGNSAAATGCQGGRSAAGFVPSHYYHSLRTESSQELNLPNCPFMLNWKYKVLSTELEHVTSVILLALKILWVSCGWASTDWCNGSAGRYPHAQCPCHSWEWSQALPAAWNGSSCIMTLSGDHPSYILLYRSIVGSQPCSDKPGDIEQQSWDNNFTFFAI